MKHFKGFFNSAVPPLFFFHTSRRDMAITSLVFLANLPGIARLSSKNDSLGFRTICRAAKQTVDALLTTEVYVGLISQFYPKMILPQELCFEDLYAIYSCLMGFKPKVNENLFRPPFVGAVYPNLLIKWFCQPNQESEIFIFCSLAFMLMSPCVLFENCVGFHENCITLRKDLT